MTFARARWFLAAILAAGGARSALAQNTGNEFWPELDVYAQQNESLRFVFADSSDQDRQTNRQQGKFAYYADFAVRPIFRKELRWKNDAFRQRYLSFRTGYEYLTSLSNGVSSHENRAIVEVTPRYRLPGAIVVDNRNRVEVRFIEGQSAAVRYRNRLQFSRDLGIGNFLFTPFASAEAFYDGRYGVWDLVRYEFGCDFPIGPHVVAEPYGAWEHDTRGQPPHVHAFGLTLKLFF